MSKKYNVQKDIASEEELKLIEDAFPEASVIGIIIFSIPLVVLLSLCVYVAVRSRNLNLESIFVFSCLFAVAITVLFCPIIVKCWHAMICLSIGKAYVHDCTVQKVDKNGEYRAYCKLEGTEDVLKIQIPYSTYSQLHLSNHLTCKVAWLGWLRPTLLVL